jgi:hypothetical protein
VILALFSYFLDYTFWRGSVFQAYLPWLAKIQLKKFDKKQYELIKAMPEKEARVANYIQAAEQYFFFKMLGGCVICLNIWIGFYSWLLISWHFDLEWYFGFAYIMTSSWLIRKLVGVVYK